MDGFAVGQVVSCKLPFSDLRNNKHRPALVVARADFGDLILCQITSKAYSSTSPIQLTASDFATGGLPINSYVRPDKLFTADASILSTTIGEITNAKLKDVHAAIQSLFVA